MKKDEICMKFEEWCSKERGLTNFRCWGETYGCEGCDDYEDDLVSSLYEAWCAALDSITE